MKSVLLKIAAAIAMSLFIFTACKSDSDQFTIEGEWKLTGITYSGTSYTVEEFAATTIGQALSEEIFCSRGMSLIFQAGGNGMINNSCSSTSSSLFTYTYQDKKVEMTSTYGGSQATTFAGTISDDYKTLRVDREIGVLTITTEFAKQ